ncbi:MAG: dioxygenase [Alphaproteobacteria bacterium]|nr:dioxygenase [Alphaproteobacteria bacterium]
MLPSIFVSHGAPTLPLEDAPAREFLRDLGRGRTRPNAILCVSAHWETDEPAVSEVERPATIHDFYGFPQALYRLTYPAPGAPALARRVAGLVNRAGLSCRLDASQGLDHGAWCPLLLMYPKADIPVAQLSVQPGRDGRHHLGLGRALSALRGEGVLILGSGGAVHNLRRLDWGQTGTPPAEFAVAFDRWLDERVTAGDAEALANFRDVAPGAAQAQPTDEHFLPLIVAFGAAGEGAQGRRLHQSYTYGSLSMAAFEFSNR